jgi:membrane protease YdiL (CAAX protease family)
MFIENALKGKPDAWRYIVGVFLIILIYFIASVPFGIAIVVEAGAEKLAGMSETEMLSVLEPNTTLFYMLLPFAFAFFGILIIARFLHDQPLKFLVTSRSSFDWSRVAFSFLLVTVIAVLSLVIDLRISPDDYVWNYDPERFFGLVLIAVLMIPLQTTAEELLMRGYLFQGLGAAFKNRLAPLLITSISFGLLHSLNPEVAKLGYGLISIYIITGLFLGIITLMDEGLELSIGFHAANNLVIALLVTSDWTAFQTDSLYKDVSEPVLIEFIILPIIIYSVVGFVLCKKYKWSAWKSKLTGSISSRS